MSDQPIHAAMAVPPDDDSGLLRADKPRTCVACGAYHGSVGAGRRCLEGEIVRLRKLLHDACDKGLRL